MKTFPAGRKFACYAAKRCLKGLWFDKSNYSSSSHLLSENTNIKVCRTNFILRAFFLWFWKLVSHIEGEHRLRVSENRMLKNVAAHVPGSYPRFILGLLQNLHFHLAFLRRSEY